MLTEWRWSKVVLLAGVVNRVRSIRAKVECKDENPDHSYQPKAEPRPELDALCVDHAPPRMNRDSQRPYGDRCFSDILKRSLGRAVSTTVHLGLVGPLGVKHSPKGHQQFADKQVQLQQWMVGQFTGSWELQIGLTMYTSRWDRSKT